MNCFTVLVTVSYQQHAQGTGDSKTRRHHSSSSILTVVALLSDYPVTSERLKLSNARVRCLDIHLIFLLSYCSYCVNSG